MSLSQLREMSNKYGRNPEYVLAGGGNTSFKDDKTLYIKGSGVSLANIDEDGFVKLDRAKLQDIFSNKYSEDTDTREAEVLTDMMAARLPGEEHKRPSVETLLHEVYAFNFILHIHPSRINGLTCATNVDAAFEKHFAKNSIWIEPIMPGYVLAVVVKDKINEFVKKNNTLPKYIFLENHGVFIGGNTLAEIDEGMDNLNKVFDAELKIKPDFSEVEFDKEKAALLAPAIRAMLSPEGALGIVTFISNKEVMKYVKDKASFDSAYTSFSPDHMVYCYDQRLFIESDEIEDCYNELKKGIEEFNKKNGKAPKIIGVKGLGVFACGASKKEADIAADVFLDAVKVATYAGNFGGGKPLPDSLIYAINNWEVERYRKKVSLSASGNNRLSGLVTIVTGSAQGFGKGIAEHL